MCMDLKNILPCASFTLSNQESQSRLLSRLHRCGFTASTTDIFSSLTAARNYVEANGLRPMLLLEEEAMEVMNMAQE